MVKSSIPEQVTKTLRAELTDGKGEAVNIPLVGRGQAVPASDYGYQVTRRLIEADLDNMALRIQKSTWKAFAIFLLFCVLLMAVAWRSWCIHE